MSEFVAVAQADSVAEGEGRTVEVRGRRFALWRVEGAFHAIDDACPHRGGPLGAGVLQDGRVHCPLHGWAFDPRTGACLSNPERPVACYPTKVEDGVVWIDLQSSQNV
ncbi:MAG: Rieske (2Fe-2S) protein [Verrucomicrobiae bacterium]|nr:Rieske (2Fe-2S) protein [Verrucomicrobiae bacterium]